MHQLTFGNTQSIPINLKMPSSRALDILLESHQARSSYPAPNTFRVNSEMASYSFVFDQSPITCRSELDSPQSPVQLHIVSK
jgi:hypothetical protein